MYPSIAFNFLYHRENQNRTQRSLARLPENFLRDLGLTPGQLLAAPDGRWLFARPLAMGVLLAGFGAWGLEGLRWI